MSTGGARAQHGEAGPVTPAAGIALVERLAARPYATAIVAADGVWTYAHLLDASATLAHTLLDDRTDLDGARVAVLVEPGGRHAAALLGAWRAGGIAVPLAPSHPVPELEYVLADSGASTLIADAGHRGRVEALAGRLGIRVVDPPPAPPAGAAAAAAGPPAGRTPSHGLPPLDEARRALIVYTSGTEGRPKGAVHTHRGLRANIASLVEAWAWSEHDRTLLVLPLHHVHGLINVLLCALWAGARCDVLPRFDADATWDRIVAGGLTLFMAVPTIYARLIGAWEAAPPDRRAAMTRGCRAMRLMVSGSAALPVPTLERWREIAGHTLLERYGMTEIGMALSNPLAGERRPGRVGTPLPGVEVRLVDDAGDAVPDGTPGEIEVRGPGVFLEYWGRPAETRAAFRDDWFRTGDIAVLEGGAYRILGRRSVDMLKTGGYKVSALEIEDVLRGHPAVADCAVVGLPDADLGERIAAAVIAREGAMVEGDALRAWARARLAPYKTPHVVVPVAALPRNAMGKVEKPAVRAMLAGAA
jgi:malonyl-CoA/methylmalonyl-CoA synthetase